MSENRAACQNARVHGLPDSGRAALSAARSLCSQVPCSVAGFDSVMPTLELRLMMCQPAAFRLYQPPPPPATGGEFWGEFQYQKSPEPSVTCLYSWLPIVGTVFAQSAPYSGS